MPRAVAPAGWVHPMIPRRTFLKHSTLAGLTAAWTAALSRVSAAPVAATAPAPSAGPDSPPDPIPSVHVFSKHLQWLDYEAMAEQAAALGFDGVDLTVRPGGHVEPARVRQDLPRAVGALRRAGLPPRLCTTALTHADDPTCDALLGALADSGLRHLRLGWHKFPPGMPLPAAIESCKPVAERLAAALARRNLRGAFQNHSGTEYVGASLWELWQVIDGLDPQRIGLQFDIRHATVERGLSWANELALAAPKIATLACKDFRWTDNPTTGRGEVRDVPFGQGWVDWDRYFALLRNHAVSAPTSLHFEYPLGGAEHGHRELTVDPAVVLAAMRRDRAALRRRPQTPPPPLPGNA